MPSSVTCLESPKLIAVTSRAILEEKYSLRWIAKERAPRRGPSPFVHSARDRPGRVSRERHGFERPSGGKSRGGVTYNEQNKLQVYKYNDRGLNIDALFPKPVCMRRGASRCGWGGPEWGGGGRRGEGGEHREEIRRILRRQFA